MPSITPEEIAKLKDELRKDLEALERVERLIAGRNGAEPAKPSIPNWEPLGRPSRPLSELLPPSITEETGLGLKQLCIEGLKRAGAMGAPPKDLLQYCKLRGYRFTSDANGSASITTALARLITENYVRREEGRYFWIAA